MGARYEDTLNKKVLVVTPDTLVVGVDIAKLCQWARFALFRGLERGNALKFNNRKDGFESLLARIRETCKSQGFARAVVGMEPTGRYWKPLANWLDKQDGIEGVIVNTYATIAKRRSLTTTARQSATRRMR